MKHVLKRGDAAAAARRRSPSARTRWASRCRSRSGCGGPARDFVARRALRRDAARDRDADRQPARCSTGSARETRFGRKVWGLLCLELWQQAFHDREHDFKRLLDDERTGTTTMKVLITGGGGLHRLAPRRPAAGARRRGARHRQLRDRPPRQPGRARRPDARRGLDRRRRRSSTAPSRASAPDVRRPRRRLLQGPRRLGRGRRARTRSARANVVKARAGGRRRAAVYFQTALCYGMQPLEQPITLDHPIRPDSSYAISKTAGEQYIELGGLDFVSFRLANAYGPRNVSRPAADLLPAPDRAASRASSWTRAATSSSSTTSSTS